MSSSSHLEFTLAVYNKICQYHILCLLVNSHLAANPNSSLKQYIWMFTQPYSAPESVVKKLIT